MIYYCSSWLKHFLDIFAVGFFSTKWPSCLQGPQLTVVSEFSSLIAWPIVLWPTVLPNACGTWLMSILDQHITGLPGIIVTTTLLLAFYVIMLSCTTQWQTLRMYIQYFYQIS